MPKTQVKKSKVDKLRTWAAEHDVQLLFFDGLDEAVVGVGSQYTQEPCVIYDRKVIIDCLMKQDKRKVSRDEKYESAIEWLGHNIECSWVGKTTPIIIDHINDLE